MAKKYKPFATGSQFGDWMGRNCDACKKGFDNKGKDRWRCEWEKALCLASIGDGQIAESVAKAIGYLDSEGCDLWECPEWERGRK